jgi:rod shape-determining protein MreD
VIRRALALALLLLTVTLVQVSVLPGLLRTDFVADLVVLVVVLVTLEEGAALGLRTAAVGGLLIDLLASTLPIGSTILVYGLIAYLVGIVRPYLGERAAIATALLAGGAAGLSVLLAGGLQTLLSEGSGAPVGLTPSGALVVASMGALLTPPMLRLVRRSLGAAPQDRAADMRS